VVWLDNNLHGDVITFDIALYLRELNPKMPIIIFTGCDYCASMQNVPDSRLMTHYGLLSKNTYRLPEQLVETIREVNAGRIIIDPDIAHWQHKVNKHKRNSPLLLLSSIEQEVIARLAQGMTNKEIANDLGLKDERTVSRINGSIYTAWGVPAVGAFEKVARTRATLIYLNDSLITWDACGKPELPEQHSKHRHKNYKNF
jgi:DNA-binding NarL/FixJ family response regulator